MGARPGLTVRPHQGTLGLSPRPDPSVRRWFMLRSFVTLGAPVGLTVGSVAAKGPPWAPPSARGRTFLFWYDHGVLYRSGTTRVLHPARRHSERPLIAQTRPWVVAIGRTSVYRDPASGKYQLWYQADAGNRAGDKKLKCVVCYAESDDGLNFRKPDLDLVPFKEHARTNIVLTGSGGYGDRYCNSVLVDPRDPDPARRYKMAYYDWVTDGGREYAGLCVAFSADGSAGGSTRAARSTGPRTGAAAASRRSPTRTATARRRCRASRRGRPGTTR